MLQTYLCTIINYIRVSYFGYTHIVSNMYITKLKKKALGFFNLNSHSLWDSDALEKIKIYILKEYVFMHLKKKIINSFLIKIKNTIIIFILLSGQFVMTKIYKTIIFNLFLVLDLYFFNFLFKAKCKITKFYIYFL